MTRSLYILMLLLFSCTVEKKDILYGEEVCSHCHMVIMDSRYGAEIVTNKGKAFKFDAMECLINYKRGNPEIEQDIHSEWTNVYNLKASLHDASQCFYLRSAELPSPMGMYINAFENKSNAEEFKNRHGGVVYSWSEMNDQFALMPALNQDN